MYNRQVEAIITDSQDDGKFFDLNSKYSNIWPVVSQIRDEDVPADAKEWADVPNKMEHFSEKPGKGD